MTTSVSSEIYFDPWDPAIFNEPYGIYRRLREEMPLYYNERYDFYAVSRFADVERGMSDRDTFRSYRGDMLDMIQADIDLPLGILQFEEEPIHTIHRGLLSRVFTPKTMSELEPQVRAYCARILDPLVEQGEFDFVADIARKLPMRVIGMLIGVPEEYQDALREHFDAMHDGEEGRPKDFSEEGQFDGEIFADYVDWRHDNPSDDLMTRLIVTDFEDEHGAIRRLTREEVMVYVNSLAGAGNETTNRLIGWTGGLLGQHPDARHEIAEDRSLIRNAVEEILRYEPPNYGMARLVDRDTQIQGQTVKAGSALLLLVPSANRDEEVFPHGDDFDIHREIRRHFSFGYGAHFCLGASLARMEGRIVLDEILDRFPEWEVDWDGARLQHIVGHRGYGTLPVAVP